MCNVKVSVWSDQNCQNDRLLKIGKKWENIHTYPWAGSRHFYMKGSMYSFNISHRLNTVYVDVQRQGFSLIGSKLPKRQGFENGWTYAHWLEVVNGSSIWIICTAFLLLLSSLMEAVHGGSQPSDGSSCILFCNIYKTTLLMILTPQIININVTMSL